ncbi:hypothetical protein Tco_1419521 [Tanacetum coccineum]
MDLKTAQTTTTAKLPILKQENGNSFKPAAQTTTNADGISTSLIPGPVTTEEKASEDCKSAGYLGNKPDLDTMSFDDLYNNFKMVEQEVKGTTSPSSSLSSHNMAFVSSPSSTNEVNIAYVVSTANTQVSLASTQVSTTNTQVSTANLSDATVYAFLANQPNGSQLVHEDLEQIHEDDLEEMDFKWQLALLSMRTRSPRWSVSTATRWDTLQGNVEDLGTQIAGTGIKIALDGQVIFTPKFDLSCSGLEGFQQSEFEGYGPKSVSEDISNEVKESPDALLVEELVSNDKLEKKTIFPTIAKIEFVRSKQQEKPVRKPVEYAKMLTAITIKGKGWLKAVNTARPNSAVVNAVRANQVNAVKASACWVWRPTKLNSALITLKRHNYVDGTSRSPIGHLQKEDQGYVDSGCLRHMTGNMSYLSDFKEFDGGYVTFGEEQMEFKAKQCGGLEETIKYNLTIGLTRNEFPDFKMFKFVKLFLHCGTDIEEKDEKQSQNDKTGLGMEK